MLAQLMRIFKRRCLAGRNFSAGGIVASPQQLAHEVVSSAGSGDRTLLLLHGLLGNRKNLKTFAKMIVKAHPRYSEPVGVTGWSQTCQPAIGPGCSLTRMA